MSTLSHQAFVTQSARLHQVSISCLYVIPTSCLDVIPAQAGIHPEIASQPQGVRAANSQTTSG
jgi:hypothetical protein